MVDIYQLVTGIIILIFGIIVYALRNSVGADLGIIFKWGGIVLAVIGFIVMILAIVLPSYM